MPDTDNRVGETETGVTVSGPTTTVSGPLTLLHHLWSTCNVHFMGHKPPPPPTHLQSYSLLNIKLSYLMSNSVQWCPLSIVTNVTTLCRTPSFPRVWHGSRHVSSHNQREIIKFDFRRGNQGAVKSNWTGESEGGRDTNKDHHCVLHDMVNNAKFSCRTSGIHTNRVVRLNMTGLGNIYIYLEVIAVQHFIQIRVKWNN